MKKVERWDFGIKKQNGKFVVYRNCDPFHEIRGEFTTLVEAEAKQAECRLKRAEALRDYEKT